MTKTISPGDSPWWLRLLEAITAVALGLELLILSAALVLLLQKIS